MSILTAHSKSLSLPESLQQNLHAALEAYQQSNSEKKIAESILKLSDFFIDSPAAATPWTENWAQLAYISYFLPLNFLRVLNVIQEAEQRNFFHGLTHMIDFGAGLGTASLAFDEKKLNFTKSLIEKNSDAQKISKKYFSISNSEWSNQFSNSNLKKPKETVCVFSYSLTELSSLPEWALQAEALMILEPATQDDGRKLMELRQKLIQAGWSIWAPCTHQGLCPLLTQSKRDWCHDRLHFEQPDWWQKLELHLPMKNKTLTTSYLLARKTPPSALPENTVRTVSDLLKEKGKDRQLICRSSEREFLTWMHKNKNTAEHQRGILLNLPEDLQKVANELRVLTKS